ncbi:MAG: hypothetical protein J5496_01895 [Lachnospiraceae bacterium]|nr:hypothetical protein [Lachnospiraceae bacterium]
MKSDKLMDAITEIDEDLLTQAEKEPTKKERAAAGRVIPFSPAWIRRVCAGLALVLLVGGSVWMISRQSTVRQGSEETTAPWTETVGVITGGETQTKTEIDPSGVIAFGGNDLAGSETSESAETSALGATEGGTSAGSEDPAWKEAALVRFEYPEEWPFDERYGGIMPRLIRTTAGKETADLYRSFFADIILKLLSDNEQDNSVMSPVNVFMAAAMLAEISGGETQQEVLDTLGVGSLSDLRDQAKKLWGLCYRDDGQEKLVLGNSVWLSDALTYREDSVKQLAESYYASAFRGEMGSEAYNTLFRSWLNEMTGGLLKEQVESMCLQPFVTFALISSICLETHWTAPFDTKETKYEVFHAAQGEQTALFMNQKEAARYYVCGENYRMIRLQTYQGYVWLFLPDEGVSVADMMQTESFRDWLAHTNRDDFEGLETVSGSINVSVPKLDIDASLDLIDSLTALEIRNAFDPGKADLSPLLGGSGGCIDSAEQKSRLVMDENGVEAASVVAMSMAAAAPQAPEFDFVLDRPFFLLVTGPESVPLFAAVVNSIEP